MSGAALRLQPGDRVDRFTLLGHLGEGGQGAVWKAQDGLPPHNLVALKLVGMRRDTLGDPERARREARILAQLRHPGLVRCSGLFEDLERGLLVLVMELVDGQPVSRVLDDARFERRHREAVLWQLAQTLAYLHGASVVHRDLKPENVLLGQGFWETPFVPGVVKLVDLGIAVSAGNAAPLTRELTALGTPAYMAPEALEPGIWGGNTKSSPLNDLFAFGVLGWRLLSGRHPAGLPPSATAIDYAAAYRAAGQGQMPWPAVRLNHPWADVLRACLALAPAQRSLPMADLATRLSAGAHGGASLQIIQEAIPIPSAGPPSTDRTRPQAAGTPLPTAPVTPMPGSPVPGVTSSRTVPAPLPLQPLVAPPPIPTGSAHQSAPHGASTAVVVAALLVGLGGLSIWALSRALSGPSDGRVVQTMPTAPATVTAVATRPPTARPGATSQPSNTCACDTTKTSRPCASHRTSIPFGCRTSLPTASGWSLRLSYVAVRDDAGKAQDLANVAPQATVRLCLAGTNTCASTTVSGARLPSCGRGSTLPVTISDLTRMGLDISVEDATGRVLGSARGARYNEIGATAVCHGLVFGKGAFGPGPVESVAVFLDDP